MATFVQGSGTAVTSASPDYPISVISCGDKTVNLFDGQLELGGYNVSGTKIAKRDSTTIQRSANLTKVKPNTTYTLSYTCSASDGWIMGVQEDGETYVTDGTVSSGLLMMIGRPNGAISSYTFTTTATTYYLAFYNTFGTTESAKLSNVMLVEGSTAPTSYIPYGYQIPTVVGSNCGVVDLGSLTFSVRSSSSSKIVFEATISNKAGGYQNLYVDGYASTGSGGNPDIGVISGASSDARIFIGEDITKYPNAIAFKQAMSGVYLYYQRTTDTSWTTPTTTPVYLDNPIRKVGNFSDIITY